MARPAVTREDANERILRRIEQGEELCRRSIRTQEELENAYSEGTRWDTYNSDLLKLLFNSTPLAKEYGGLRFGEDLDKSFPDRAERWRSEIKRGLTVMYSIRDRLELIYELGAVGNYFDNKSVFLVHGHNVAQRESVARFLEKLGLIVIMLQEKASGGRTIIEQFEQHSKVGFAVVLLTADDVGGSRVSPGVLHPRARQNVIFELGYFCGFLGRARACALYEDDVELPSDFHGVIYISLSLVDWRVRLVKELRLADMAIDSESLFG